MTSGFVKFLTMHTSLDLSALFESIGLSLVYPLGSDAQPSILGTRRD